MRREYNVRIIVKKDGSLELGFVHGLYKTKDKHILEWKSVPESIKEKLALKLGCKF